MNTGGWLFLGLALLLAALDWWAVIADRRSLEYFAKPATMVALIGMALLLNPADSTVRAWFLVALVASLAGDVCLMLPQDLFVAGLASFLIGHLAYVIGLLQAFDSTGLALLGLVEVGVALAVVLPRVLRGVKKSDPSLLAPVVVYIAAISAMVIGAWASGVALAIVGAMLFYLSDATLAWNRFLHEYRKGRVLVMVTYHLGQIGLTASLVSLR